MVYQLGTNPTVTTAEISFVVKSSAGSVILNYTGGVAFTSTKIFATFCPSMSCKTVNKVTYTLSMTDAYGDGWEGSVLVFKQLNGANQTFGEQFTYGLTYPSQNFTFDKYSVVNIGVYQLGPNTQ